MTTIWENLNCWAAGCADKLVRDMSCMYRHVFEISTFLRSFSILRVARYSWVPTDALFGATRVLNFDRPAVGFEIGCRILDFGQDVGQVSDKIKKIWDKISGLVCVRIGVRHVFEIWSEYLSQILSQILSEYFPKLWPKWCPKFCPNICPKCCPTFGKRFWGQYLGQKFGQHLG